jgi:hypothetical protein
LIKVTAEIRWIEPKRRRRTKLDFYEGGFAGRDPMDYQGFTNDSLIKMYEGVREALAADEALGGEGKFRVRKTPAWKLHAADLEAEMARRGITFEVIEWYEAYRPVEEMHAPSAVPEHEEMHGASAMPEQSPQQAEPSRSQMVLASTIDLPNDPPSSPAKEKPPRKRRTRASDNSS